MPQTEEEKLRLEKMKLENRIMREKLIKGYVKDLGIPILIVLFCISIVANGGHITFKLWEKGKFNPSMAIEASGEEGLDEEIASTELDEVVVEGAGMGSGGIIARKTPRLLKKEDRIKKKIRMHKKHTSKGEYMQQQSYHETKTVSKYNYGLIVFSILCLIGMYTIIRWKKKGVL